MGMAMLNSLGLEDMHHLSKSFHTATSSQPQKKPLAVYSDQLITLTLLFPREHRPGLHQEAFGDLTSEIIKAHQERQAQIALLMKHNKFLKLIAKQLDKVSPKYEIGILTDDRNLALEIMVQDGDSRYCVIPVYPMSKIRNREDENLGEVRIAKKIVEVQGVKFGGFLEWVAPRGPEETTKEVLKVHN